MPDEYHYPPRWELVSENTYRLAVPGGWLVRDIHTFISGDKSCSMAIGSWTVLDENHDKWILK